MWHYKCIRPILNDIKTWPSFLCPNCRAVADLEADVDDLDDGDWEDEEIGEDENRNDIMAPDVNGVNKEHDLPVTAPEDKPPATQTAGLLPITISPDSNPAHSSIGLSSSASADQHAHPPQIPSNYSYLSSNNHPNASTPAAPSSIIDRRNASRMTTQQHSIEDPTLTTRSDDVTRRASNYTNYLRPITPTEPILQEDVTPNGSPSALVTGADLTNDGPMTPTNNAGPFVFDGSAGRAAGRRTVASIVQETESAA